MTEVMSVAHVSTDTMHINDTENTTDIDDANETENMSDDKNHEEEHATGSAECVTEEVEMNDVADKPKKIASSEQEEEEPVEEIKTTIRARKRERVHKTNDANITEVDNMNDVADESHDTDLANMSEVAFKQEVRDLLGLYFKWK